MSSRKTFFLFIFILLIAAFVRLYRLGSAPSGLAWDEASIAYNGFAVVHEHRDEWLEKMPLSFRSFGEYKAPVAIYVSGITTWLLGINNFTIRLPMALAGIVTVISTYYLALFIFEKKEYALLAMALVAFSPENILYSRIAFESSLGIAAVTVGVTLWLYARKWPKLYFLASFCFVFGMYANHVTKIVTPLLWLSLLVLTFHEFRKHWQTVLVSLFVGAVILLPLANNVLNGPGNERFFMTSAIADHHGLKPLPEVFQIVKQNLTAHFTPQFLLFGQHINYRDGNGVYGVLTYTEYFFAIIGVLVCIFRHDWRKKYGWILLFFLIGIIPSVISIQAPHSNRMHHIVPWIQLIAVIGYQQIVLLLKEKAHTYFMLFVAITMLLEICWQTWVYLTVFGVKAAPDFQYGYEEAIAYTTQHENEVHDVIFTDAYQQDYIYLLLFKHIPPIEYHHGALLKYRIQSLHWDNLVVRKDVMIVGTPAEIPANAEHIVHEVLYPDGTVAFRIVKL